MRVRLREDNWVARAKRFAQLTFRGFEIASVAPQYVTRMGRCDLDVESVLAGPDPDYPGNVRDQQELYRRCLRIELDVDGEPLLPQAIENLRKSTRAAVVAVKARHAPVGELDGDAPSALHRPWGFVERRSRERVGGTSS